MWKKCEGALVYNQDALSIEMHMHAKNVSHEDFLEWLAERCKRAYLSPIPTIQIIELLHQYMYILVMSNDYFYFCKFIES